MTTENEREKLTVHWDGGYRMIVESRKHRLVSDQPAEEGGRDGGMSPVEIFVGSMGACISFFAVRFFERHGFSPERFKVSIEWDYAEKPHRIGSVFVDIDCPLELDPPMKDRFIRVIEGCTVHQTMFHPPKIDIRWTPKA
jgi:putative redox protein